MMESGYGFSQFMFSNNMTNLAQAYVACLSPSPSLTGFFFQYVQYIISFVSKTLGLRREKKLSDCNPRIPSQAKNPIQSSFITPTVSCEARLWHWRCGVSTRVHRRVLGEPGRCRGGCIVTYCPRGAPFCVYWLCRWVCHVLLVLSKHADTYAGLILFSTILSCKMMTESHHLFLIFYPLGIHFCDRVDGTQKVSLTMILMTISQLHMWVFHIKIVELSITCVE